MSKFKESWQQRTALEKVLLVVRIVCAVAIIVLALLSLLQIWIGAALIYMPLSAVLMLLQAYENRKNDKTVLFVSLGTAVFILGVWLFLLLR